MMARWVTTCCFYFMLLWLATGLLLGNIACLPLWLVPRKTREPFMQWLISNFLRVFLWIGTSTGVMRLDLSALDVLNNERQTILVANHPSMIDVFLILSRVRRSICLMKASISSNIFLGVGAHLAGYVSNWRVDQTLRKAISSVREGGLLLMFPEGTRTERLPINPLKSGFALIASKSQAPIQTILIWTDSAYLGKGWKIWRAPDFPMVFKATLGEKMVAQDSVVATTEKLQQYFETAVNLPMNSNFKVQD